MPTSTATVHTSRASRYLQQLCKHFGHKVPVEFTPEKGEIALPFGTCALRAGDTALAITATGDAAEMDRLEKVIADHLLRFAFRENIDIQWHRAA